MAYGAHLTNRRATESPVEFNWCLCGYNVNTIALGRMLLSVGRTAVWRLSVGMVFAASRPAGGGGRHRATDIANRPAIAGSRTRSSCPDGRWKSRTSRDRLAPAGAATP